MAHSLNIHRQTLFSALIFCCKNILLDYRHTKAEDFFQGKYYVWRFQRKRICLFELYNNTPVKGKLFWELLAFENYYYFWEIKNKQGIVWLWSIFHLGSLLWLLFTVAARCFSCGERRILWTVHRHCRLILSLSSVVSCSEICSRFSTCSDFISPRIREETWVILKSQNAIFSSNG